MIYIQCTMLATNTLKRMESKKRLAYGWWEGLIKKFNQIINIIQYYQKLFKGQYGKNVVERGDSTKGG